MTREEETELLLETARGVMLLLQLNSGDQRPFIQARAEDCADKLANLTCGEFEEGNPLYV